MFCHFGGKNVSRDVKRLPGAQPENLAEGGMVTVVDLWGRSCDATDVSVERQWIAIWGKVLV